MSSFTVNGATYEMIQSGFMFAEARAMEKVTGFTFSEMLTDPKLRTSTVAIQAMIWVSMKRTEPELKFSDLDTMSIDEITFNEDPPAVAAQDADPTVAVEVPPLTALA